MKMKFPGHDSADWAAPALLTAILWGVLYWLTPLMLDDWQFIGTYREANGGDAGFSLSAWKAYMAELRDFDNSRIGNLISPFTTLWSPWKEIFPWLTGCLTALLFWFAARLGFGRRMGWTGYSVMWLALTLFLPWRNALLVRDYALNYIYSGCVTFTAVWLIMGLRRWDARFWCALVISVLAGGWHEGFAVPALCGLGFVALLRRLKMSPQWWVCVIVYAVCGAVMTLSPGTLSRSSREMSMSYDYLSPNFLFDNFLPSFLVIVTFVTVLFPRGRRRLATLMRPAPGDPDSWVFPLFGSCAVVAGCFPFIINYTPRVCFWASVSSLVALAILLRPLWFGMWRWLRSVAGLFAVCLCTAHLCLAIYWENKVRIEWEEVTSAVSASPTGTVFIDCLTNQDAPLVALHFPMLGMWDEPFNIACFGRALGNRDIAVVPLSLADARPEECRKIPAGFDLHLSPGGDALFAVPASVPGYRRSGPGNMYIDRPVTADIELNDGRMLSGVTVPFLYYINQEGDTLFRVVTPKIDPSGITSLRLNGPIECR